MEPRRLLILILAATFIALQAKLWFGDGSVLANQRLGKVVEAQRAEVAQLQERNRSLEAQVKDLKEQLDAIEELARNDFGFIREGETFVYFSEWEPDDRDKP